MSNLPNSTMPVQTEATQTTRPTSESLIQQIGGVANQALANCGKVGDVVYSYLNLTQFQAQRDTTWVLADGSSAAGTNFGTLTGATNLPDMRGVYPRGCDNGRGLDPNGTQAPGNYVGDQFASHTHTYAVAGSGGGNSPLQTTGSSLTDTTNATGGTETAPKTTYLNAFIKVNY